MRTGFSCQKLAFQSQTGVRYGNCGRYLEGRRLYYDGNYGRAAGYFGASFWQKTRHITIPLLAPVLINATVLNLTYGFRVFDIIYSLTNGGPGHATEVLNTAVYSEFAKGNYAMGTTLSSILFIFVMGISYFLLKALEMKEED